MCEVQGGEDYTLHPGVWCLGIGVQGLRYGVRGVGFEVVGFGAWISSFGGCGLGYGLDLTVVPHIRHIYDLV